MDCGQRNRQQQIRTCSGFPAPRLPAAGVSVTHRVVTDTPTVRLGAISCPVRRTASAGVVILRAPSNIPDLAPPPAWVSVTGRQAMKKISFGKQSYGPDPLSYGGTLRQKRDGRGARPLSPREPLHLVLKANKERVRGGLRTPRRFLLIHQILEKYSKKFFVKIEQISVQADHIHLNLRTSRRSNYQSFFRVYAGQIAQRFEKEGVLTVVTDTPARLGKRLWRYRPFSRVVRGYRAYRTLRNYIQLNEKEATGKIPYRASRLRGLSNAEWEILWS